MLEVKLKLRQVIKGVKLVNIDIHWRYQARETE
jgi:hypothetical protein